MSEVSLRAATPDDCRFVWEVNNEPSVRAQSIRPAPIPFADHERWFARKIEDSAACLWVAEAPERVGVVRCDRLEGHAEVSLALLPSARGRGLGRAMIAAASAEGAARLGVREVVALVRPENLGSLGAFARAGFVRVGEEVREGVPLVRLAWSAPA